MAGRRTGISHGALSAMKALQSMNERLGNLGLTEVNRTKTDAYGVLLQVGARGKKQLRHTMAVE